MSDDNQRNFMHKVGIKVLTEIQLENILPTYENLFHKFDICRNVATMELDSSSRHYQDNFMYDNVFSILGGRGTGKTSVAFTLQKMIKDRYEKKYHDVVLPLIIPEAIPENCTILGWLLAIVKDQISVMEQKAKSAESETNMALYWDKCRIKGETLEDNLEHMTQLFHAGSYNPANEASYYKAVDNSVVQAEDYYQFAKSIADLWDAWIKRIQELNGAEGGKKICPMIYFIFDDVDLAPDRIEQLLSVIIKYLSHPNIIVLATADEDLFLEVIEKHLDKNIGRLPREWREYLATNKYSRFLTWDEGDIGSAASDELISKTAKRYLGKVMPTSTRYYLRTFHTAKQKELFCMEDNSNLGQDVQRQIEHLLVEIGNKDIPNFMLYNNDLIYFYLKYFGSTSRQIGNVYVALKEFLDNMCRIVKNENYDEDKTVMSIYQSSRYFIRVTLNANHELSDAVQQIDEFMDEIFLSEYNQWKIYINYGQLNEFLYDKLRNESVQLRIEVGLQLYSLFAFIENILLIMEAGVAGGITNRKKIHAVPFMTEYIEKVAMNNSHVLRKGLEPNEYFWHYNNLFDRMEVIINNSMSDMKFNMEYFYNFRNYSYRERKNVEGKLEVIYEKDRRWFRNLVAMLSDVYGNVYLFDANNMAECLPYLNQKFLSQYERIIDWEVKNQLVQVYMKMEMQKVWKKSREFYRMFLRMLDKEDIPGHYVVDFERIKADIRKENEGERYIGLSVVVSKSLSYFKKDKKIRQLLGDAENMHFIKSNAKEQDNTAVDNSEEVRSKMLKYQGEISYFSSRAGKYGILENMEEVIYKLERLKDLYPIRKRELSDIIRSIRPGRDRGKKESYMIISKGIYQELNKELNLIAGSLLDKRKEIFLKDPDEAEEIRNIIFDVAPLIDMGIDCEDNDELNNVIKLSMNVIILEVLQAIYIYQTINNRYENKNNLSSCGLEKVGNTDKNTYYFTIFQDVVNYLQGKDHGRTDIRIKNDIESAFMEERQRYVNKLIAEAADE